MSKTARKSTSTFLDDQSPFKKSNVLVMPFLPYEMYHIMAQYHSDNLTEQMEFLEAISNSDELDFVSVVKNFSLVKTSNITDREWIKYKSLLSNTPRNLKITSDFTTTTKELQKILISCPCLEKLDLYSVGICYSNYKFEHLCFPITLKNLSINFNDDGSPLRYILEDVPHLQILKCANYNDYYVDNLVLPQSLLYLDLGPHFNQPVDNLVLPPSLHTLQFSHDFNQPVDNLVLPPSLHTLQFGCDFNQPIIELGLPQSLHTLQFGHNFNQPVDNLVLPPKLHTLKFGRDFNQPIDQLVLPFKLHTLKFGNNFHQSINKLKLPRTLTNLSVNKFNFTF
jgi:hypothetical protein